MALKKIGNKGKSKSSKANTRIIDNTPNLDISNISGYGSLENKSKKGSNFKKNIKKSKRVVNSKQERMIDQIPRQTKEKSKRSAAKKKSRKIEVKYRGYKADKKGITLRKRGTKILKDQVDTVEHAGAFDYDVKSRPKRFKEERGKKSSVYPIVWGDEDYEILYHTHPIANQYKKGSRRYNTRMELSKVLSVADISVLISDNLDTGRDRHLLITPDKSIIEYRIVDKKKALGMKGSLKSSKNKAEAATDKKYKYTSYQVPGMTKKQEEESIKWIRYYKSQWKKILLDEHGILVLDHGKRSEIKLDIPVKHSGKDVVN